MVFAVLPVKDPRFANQRLSSRLTPSQREALARTMFEETLGKLLGAKRVDDVAVASCDEGVLEIAKARGAKIIFEEKQSGHSASADRAAAWCAERGASRVLLAPIDVPLASPADFDELVATAPPPPSLVIVPSRDGTGTNALVQSPPACIGCKFGPDSYRLHREAASAAGAAFVKKHAGGLTFDIDTPEDLKDFLRTAPPGPTQSFLKELSAAWSTRT